jgi:pyruvate,water dikinase
MEFMIAEQIGVHPMALAHPERVTDLDELRKIDELAGGRAHGSEWFVERLAAGLGMLCAVASPGPAVVRLSDFKTNEYARLLGGRAFEPEETNPMLGWRGASRYADPGYRDGFSLECRALRRVREVLGQSNLAIMVPFCRTPDEADTVLAVLASEGLVRGEDGLQIWLMAEIPSNIIRAEEFAERCDGFSIGSNDLTQLTLGVDRESEVLADRFGPDDPAVLRLIHDLIQRAHAVNTPVSFCGQAPSNDPSYARRLVEMGIDSISVAPDSFVAVTQNVASAESS